MAVWLQAGNSAVSWFSGLPFLRACGAFVLLAAWQLASKRGDFYNLLWMLVFGFAMVLIMIWRPRGLVSTREPSLHLGERKA